MDIHPPEHPIRSLQDFLVQIFTVTCGIVIALSLEGLLTHSHEQGLARHARADFLAEIGENRAKVKAVLTQDAAQEPWLRSAIVFAVAKLRHAPAKEPDEPPVRSFVVLPSAAWDTSLAVQAMSELRFAEVRVLSTAYNRQAALNNLEAAAREQWIGLAAWGEFDDANDADIRDAVKHARIAVAYVRTLVALETQVIQQYKSAQEELAKH